MTDRLVAWHQAVQAAGPMFVLESMVWDDRPGWPKLLTWHDSAGCRLHAAASQHDARSGSGNFVLALYVRRYYSGYDDPSLGYVALVRTCGVKSIPTVNMPVKPHVRIRPVAGLLGWQYQHYPPATVVNRLIKLARP